MNLKYVSIDIKSAKQLELLQILSTKAYDIHIGIFNKIKNSNKLKENGHNEQSVTERLSFFIHD